MPVAVVVNYVIDNRVVLLSMIMCTPTQCLSKNPIVHTELMESRIIMADMHGIAIRDSVRQTHLKFTVP